MEQVIIIAKIQASAAAEEKVLPGKTVAVKYKHSETGS